MQKRRQSSRMLAPSAVAKVTNSKRRDMVDASFHGMAGLLWEASVPSRCVNHVPEHLSAISPVHTVGEGWGGGASAGGAKRVVGPPPRPSPTRGEGAKARESGDSVARASGALRASVA